MGLHQAFPDAEIVGVDIKLQPRYPFRFVLGDWQTAGMNRMLDWADFIWSSPPCQHYTQMLNHGLTSRDKHPDYIAIVRNTLTLIGKPWVIENVAGAPLLNPVMLCGEMFKLRVMRHRFFECSFPVSQPAHPKHDPRGAIRKQGDGGYYFRVYGHETGKAQWGAAMGINWMKSPELAQAIPPAYSKYIGEQYGRHATNVRDAVRMGVAHNTGVPCS